MVGTCRMVSLIGGCGTYWVGGDELALVEVDDAHGREEIGPPPREPWLGGHAGPPGTGAGEPRAGPIGTRSSNGVPTDR